MTITIRPEQLAALARAMLEPLIVELARDAGAAVEDARAFVERVDASYGIREQDDVARLAAIAVERGLDFDLQPDNAWMRRVLGDADVASASSRVMRLLAERRRRERLDAHNRAIDEALED